MATTLAFDRHPDWALHLLLFTGVTNAADIRQRLMRKEMDAAVLDARMVASPFCVHAAAHKALSAAAGGKLSAASLHAELVHCLHAGRNVGEALRVLGVRPDSSDLLFAVLESRGGAAAGTASGGAADAGAGSGPAPAAPIPSPADIIALVAGVPARLDAYYGTRVEGGVVLPLADRLPGVFGAAAVAAPAPVAPGARVDVPAIIAAYKILPEELAAPSRGVPAAAGAAGVGAAAAGGGSAAPGAADSPPLSLSALEDAVVQRIATQDYR